MILKVFTPDITKVITLLKTDNEELTRHRYKADKRRSDVNFGKLSTAEIDEFGKIFKAKAAKDEKYYPGLLRQYDEWHALLSDSTGSKVIKQLHTLPTAIKAFMKNSMHKWLFYQDSDGQMNPYFVTNVEHTKGYTDRGTGKWIPPYTELKMSGYRRGSQTTTSIRWNPEDMPKTVPALFAESGLLIETEKGVKQYLEEFNRYMGLQELVGVQMMAHGFAKSSDRWQQDIISMVRDDIPTKVVLDDAGDEEKDTTATSTFVTDKFWGEIENRNGMADVYDDDDDDEDQEQTNRVELPVHPYIGAFDLDKHNWIQIHTANLQDYEWNDTLKEKLVIKREDKELIELLMNQSGRRIEDIIKGKMPGVIVLATGAPGIGKTLTAEVFSETIQKPLYNVQCSQLGISVDKIESKLETILDRASRWGAILLIDEADVYIRRRGDDIEQNAIVGVFLRLIEYYRGVLFMTSNRGDVVDDAIISRATAWVKYELPDTDQLREIWKVLGTQYDVKFSAKDLDTLLANQALASISGRTVRNLLKLARMLQGDETVTVKTIIQVSKYQSLT